MKNLLKKNTGSGSSGFTFVEVMLTLALFIILASVGFGAYFQYYKFSLMNVDITNTQSLLKNTRFRALKNPNGSDYGIYINDSTNEIISFEGEEYTPGDSSNTVLELEALQVSNLSLNPVLGSTNEIIFEASTAKTENTGSFTIGNSNYIHTFYINAQGAIE